MTTPILANADAVRIPLVDSGEGDKVQEYQDFLQSKRIVVNAAGKEVDGIHPMLFPFQQDLVRWAARKGRSGIFADTGLGKTFMQVEWARLIGGRSLIIAPLSVARQTVGEAAKINVDVHYTRSGEDLAEGINITNYEMVNHFDPGDFASVVLDESSILKSLAGKTRRKLTCMFAATPYKLCCTATPAPNDIAEIANHAEFLGIMTRTDMMAAFFVHDDKGYRLKRHAEEPFYRWLASWGMAIKKPSDLGYSDDGFALPELSIYPTFADCDYVPMGQLCFSGLKGITNRSAVRRATLRERVKLAAEIVNGDTAQWLVWCGLNDESKMLTELIPGAIEVKGADSIDSKIASIESFQNGDSRVMVTKPKIAGMGMNFQNAHKMAFVGLSDSWEQYYQAIRRCWRFGQIEPVSVYVILATIEDAIWHNIQRKEQEAERMTKRLIQHVKEFERAEIANIVDADCPYQEDSAAGKDWRIMLGDSAQRMAELDDDSIDLSVFSPPFQALYQYSPTERDLGNSSTPVEFNQHFGYIVDHLLRVTKPGRICAVHVADIPAMMVRDGYIGMKDFSGDVLRLFMDRGWIFDARIPIDKNQQAQSIRTHTKALTMKQLEKDRTWLRPALPDYILKFRKAGENEIAVVGGDVSRDLWIDWANPTWPNEGDRCVEWGAWATWYGISETDTLQGYRSARGVHRNNGGNDERHICPLQLSTIERCIRLWSNEGETVLSPFAGIGSELYQALKLGRKAIGIELKEGYYHQAIQYVKQAERADLFSFANVPV